MKKIFFIFLFYFLFINHSFANVNDFFGIFRLDNFFKAGGSDLLTIINHMAGYIIGLFYFIAVMIGVYGGFLILTSAGNEDRVKKGKNTVIFMVVGLIVVFLSSQIVSWVINVMSSEKIVGPGN